MLIIFILCSALLAFYVFVFNVTRKMVVSPNGLILNPIKADKLEQRVKDSLDVATQNFESDGLEFVGYLMGRQNLRLSITTIYIAVYYERREESLLTYWKRISHQPEENKVLQELDFISIYTYLSDGHLVSTRDTRLLNSVPISWSQAIETFLCLPSSSGYRLILENHRKLCQWVERKRRAGRKTLIFRKGESGSIPHSPRIESINELFRENDIKIYRNWCKLGYFYPRSEQKKFSPTWKGALILSLWYTFPGSTIANLLCDGYHRSLQRKIDRL